MKYKGTYVLLQILFYIQKTAQSGCTYLHFKKSHAEKSVLAWKHCSRLIDMMKEYY